MNLASSSSSSATTNAYPSIPNLLNPVVVDELVELLNKLYGCQISTLSSPYLDKYYTNDAVFEDPVGKCDLRLAFKGLEEVFSFKGWQETVPETIDPNSSKQSRYRLSGILVKEMHNDRIIFDIKAKYQLRSLERMNLGVPNVPFHTVTTMYFLQSIQSSDENKTTLPSKIRYQKDEWMGIPLLSHDKHPWIGKLAEWRREVTGRMEAMYVKSMEPSSSSSSSSSSSGSRLSEPNQSTSETTSSTFSSSTTR